MLLDPNLSPKRNILKYLQSKNVDITEDEFDIKSIKAIPNLGSSQEYKTPSITTMSNIVSNVDGVYTLNEENINTKYNGYTKPNTILTLEGKGRYNGTIEIRYRRRDPQIEVENRCLKQYLEHKDTAIANLAIEVDVRKLPFIYNKVIDVNSDNFEKLILKIIKEKLNINLSSLNGTDGNTLSISRNNLDVYSEKIYKMSDNNIISYRKVTFNATIKSNDFFYNSQSLTLTFIFFNNKFVRYPVVNNSSEWQVVSHTLSKKLTEPSSYVNKFFKDYQIYKVRTLFKKGTSQSEIESPYVWFKGLTSTPTQDDVDKVIPYKVVTGGTGWYFPTVDERDVVYFKDAISPYMPLTDIGFEDVSLYDGSSPTKDFGLLLEDDDCFQYKLFAKNSIISFDGNGEMSVSKQSSVRYLGFLVLPKAITNDDKTKVKLKFKETLSGRQKGILTPYLNLDLYLEDSIKSRIRAINNEKYSIYPESFYKVDEVSTNGSKINVSNQKVYQAKYFKSEYLDSSHYSTSSIVEEGLIEPIVLSPADGDIINYSVYTMNFSTDNTGRVNILYKRFKRFGIDDITFNSKTWRNPEFEKINQDFNTSNWLDLTDLDVYRIMVQRANLGSVKINDFSNMVTSRNLIIERNALTYDNAKSILLNNITAALYSLTFKNTNSFPRGISLYQDDLSPLEHFGIEVNYYRQIRGHTATFIYFAQFSVFLVRDKRRVYLKHYVSSKYRHPDGNTTAIDSTNAASICPHLKVSITDIQFNMTETTDGSFPLYSSEKGNMFDTTKVKIYTYDQRPYTKYVRPSNRNKINIDLSKVGIECVWYRSTNKAILAGSNYGLVTYSNGKTNIDKNQYVYLLRVNLFTIKDGIKTIVYTKDSDYVHDDSVGEHKGVDHILEVDLRAITSVTTSGTSTNPDVNINILYLGHKDSVPNFNFNFDAPHYTFTYREYRT